MFLKRVHIVLTVISTGKKKLTWLSSRAQWLKITEKVAFNIASEARSVYILSGQKCIRIAKNGQFWQFFLENATFWVIFNHCGRAKTPLKVLQQLQCIKMLLLQTLIFRSILAHKITPWDIFLANLRFLLWGEICILQNAQCLKITWKV